MRKKYLAQGHYCRWQQVRTGDLAIESPWSYPLSHNSSSNGGHLDEAERTNSHPLFLANGLGVLYIHDVT